MSFWPIIFTTFLWRYAPWTDWFSSCDNQIKTRLKHCLPNSNWIKLILVSWSRVGLSYIVLEQILYIFIKKFKVWNVLSLLLFSQYSWKIVYVTVLSWSWSCNSYWYWWVSTWKLRLWYGQVSFLRLRHNEFCLSFWDWDWAFLVVGLSSETKTVIKTKLSCTYVSQILFSPYLYWLTYFMSELTDIF